MPRGRRLYSALAVKRPLLVAFVVLAVVVFLAGLLVFAFYSLLRFQPRTELATPGILVVNLDGLVVERAQEDVFLAGFEGAQHELLDLAMALDRATEDDRIAGVYLRIGSPGMGWAKAEELRRRLLEFRESGKFVYAYTPFTDELGYYVALAADRFYVLPNAGLEMNGFRVETPFISRMLDKVGLDPQIEAIGAYKSAADVLARENMSDPDREATTALLEERYRHFVDEVVARREVDRARLTAALDEGIYLARDLETLDLIDGEAHEADVQRAAVAEALEVDPDSLALAEVPYHLIDAADYAADLPDPAESPEGDIALVYAVGAIVMGESGFDPLFGRVIGSASMVETLHEVAQDDRIDAVVLRVDSPGGDALASEEIWAAVEELREEVPVVVSMGDVAASGGYYIAAGANAIVAEPATLTGSIGVLAVLFNASELYDKLGITWDLIETNPAADFPTSTRPMTEEERRTFRLLVEDVYRNFVERVAQGRDKPVPEIDRVAQGRVWSGSQAREVGLVDTTGGLETALTLAKQAAGIDGDARVWLHVYPREQTWVERLQEAFRLRGARRAEPGVRERVARLVVRDLGAALSGMGAVLRAEVGRPLAVMPYVPTIR
jgi:protease-4